MENKQIQALLKYLSASFPNQFDYPTGDKEEDKTLVNTWKDWVGGYEVADVKAAVKKAMSGNSDYIPSPAKVANFLDDSLTPQEAWEIYDGQVDGKELTEAEQTAIERAGNAVECHKSDRKVGERRFVRKSFMDQFEAIRQRDWQQENMPNARNPVCPPGQQEQVPEEAGGDQRDPQQVVENLSESVPTLSKGGGDESKSD